VPVYLGFYSRITALKIAPVVCGLILQRAKKKQILYYGQNDMFEH
jgi:hypothetical protein